MDQVDLAETTFSKGTSNKKISYSFSHKRIVDLQNNS